jgi:hypothetical protein
VGSSSHWASSTKQTSGRSAATSANRLNTASPTTNRSGAFPAANPKANLNKAHLLAALTDAAYGTPPGPTGRRRSWRAEVEWWVIALWRLYGLHPWLVKTPTTAAPIGQNALAWTEALLRPLARARLSGGDLLAAATFVSSAVRDLARIDSELDPAAAAAYGRVLAERLDPKQFPSWPS